MHCTAGAPCGNGCGGNGVAQEGMKEKVLQNVGPAPGTGDCHPCNDAEDVSLEHVARLLQQRIHHARSKLASLHGFQFPHPLDTTDAANDSSATAVSTSGAETVDKGEVAIVHQIFRSHPLLCHLDAATTSLLMGELKREELAPAATISASHYGSSSFVILCRGTLCATCCGDSTISSTSRTTSLLLQMPFDCPRAPGQQERDISCIDKVKTRNVEAEACVKHVRDDVFSVNSLYAMLPLHTVSAGDEGATVYILQMHCFNCIIENLCLRLPATDLFSNDALHGTNGTSDLIPYAFTEMDVDEAQELQLGAHERTRRHAVVGESLLCSDTFRPRLIEKNLEERAALLQMVRSLPLFASLGERYLQFIVDAFERRVFKPGDLIVSKDGEPSHDFHWIERGAVVIDESGDDNNGDVAANPSVWRSGDCLFTEGLLHMYNARVDCNTVRRSALDQAGDTCAVLWTIRRTVLKRILMTFVLREQQRLFSLIHGVGLFSTLQRGEKLQLVDALEPVEYNTGCHLLRQAATIDCMIFIDTGTVEVTCWRKSDVAAHVRFIGRNACVGAREVLSGLGSPFDYVAHSHITAYRLSRSAMTRMFGESILQRMATTPAGKRVLEQLQVEMETLMSEELEQCDAASDSQSEGEYTDDMCPVVVKGPIDNTFLHRFLSSSVYGSVPPMQQGLAVAAFEHLEYLPCGRVLYSEKTSEAGTGQEQEHRQWLYVIADGVVTISHCGRRVARYGRGQSIGEEVLLRKRHATPVTTAAVTSPKCAVYKLDRKTFRCLLMTAYLKRLRACRVILNTTLLSSLLDVVVITALSRSATTMIFMPSEVILPQGSEVSSVELVLEGTVDVALHQVKEGGLEGAELQVIASLGPTDVIGAHDLLNQRSSVVCYIACTRVRTLRIPSWLFFDTCLQNPTVVQYLLDLQTSSRYSFVLV